MKIMKYTITLICLFFATSCSDSFLEKYPLDEINDASFWKSAQELEMYANQFYPSLKDPNYMWRQDDPTDNNGAATRDPYIWNEYVIPVTGEGWGKADWLGIRRCNYALAKIANAQKDTPYLVAEGEIRFFKSFFYFIKVKRYGDVPWFESALETNSEDLFKTRDSRQLVIINLLKDLDFAIANLPAVSNTERLTKYAALAFKAEVCLYEGTFRKYHQAGEYLQLLRDGAAAAEQIINSGAFALYSTGKPKDDYYDLFVKNELKGNKEGIMIQRFLVNRRMHNNVRQLGEPKTGYTKDFVESYLASDGLPISISPLYKGDAVFGDEFVNRDPRMSQSVYNSNRVFRIYDNGSSETKKMPEFDFLYSPTSYYILKGFSPYERDRQEHQVIIDDFIFRYGKLLVNYAEIKAELGEATQAVLDKSINLLRDRVEMPHLKTEVDFTDPNWPKWGVPVSPLINEIRRERRIELAGEGNRWDDIVRWKAGKLLENIKTVQGARDPATNTYRDLYPNLTRKWYDKFYLRPLPTQEIVLNPNLKQNPGW